MKKILCCIILLLPLGLVAQYPNIAPNATVSVSGGCKGGPCSAFNDLNFGSCTNSQVYVGTTNPPSAIAGVDYIEWEWPSVQTFDGLKIYHGSGLARVLQGATMQKWDGQQWVTTGSFSGLSAPACEATVNFAAVTASRFRITAFQMSFGQTSNPNFREIEIFAATTQNNDAGVVRTDSFQAVCPISSPVTVDIQNFGKNILDSVQVHWQVNGVVQSPVWYRTTLDTLGGTGAYKAQVVLGNYTFSTNTTYQLKYWTSLPNGLADTYNINDTLSSSIRLGPPTGLTVAQLTDSTAIINWNNLGGSGFVLLHGPAGFDPAQGGSLQNSSGSPDTITNLLPGTDYEVYIIANCAAGAFSDTSNPLSFRTLCINPDPVNLPFSENFENLQGSFIGSYTPIHCSSQAQWHFTTTNSFSGRAQFSSYSNTRFGSNHSTGLSLDAVGSRAVNDIILTLDMSAYDTASGMFITLSFHHLDHADKNDQNDRVWMRGDTSNNWVEIYNLDQAAQTATWVEARDIDLTAYLRANQQNFGSNFQLRFGQEGNGQIYSIASSDGRTFDDILIEEKSCLELQNLHFVSIDSSKVILEAGNSDGEFQYEWGPCGFFQGTGTTVTNVKHRDTINGLLPNTCYDIYVQKDCDTNGLSGVSGPFTFTTACGALQAPYHQDFDGAPAQSPLGGIDCWATYSNLAGRVNLADNFSFAVQPPSMSNAASLLAGNIYNGDTVALLSPLFSDLSGAENQLGFQAAFRDSGDHLLIGVIGNGPKLTGLQIIDTISGPADQAFHPYTLYLNDPLTLNQALRLVFIHGNGNGSILIDDVEYLNAPDCLPPGINSLTAQSLNATQANLSWASGSDGQKTYIEVGLPGFTPGAVNPFILDSVMGTIDSVVVNALSPLTAYEFYIRDRCSNDSLSPWVGPLQFTLPCNVFQAPFTEDFELASNSKDCWTNQNITGTTNWLLGTGSTNNTAITAAQSGDSNMVFDPSGSHTTRFLSPRIDLSALSNPQLNFYYAQESGIFGNPNGLKVYVKAEGTSGWTEIFSDLQAQSVWTQAVVQIPRNLASNTIRLAFEGIAGSAAPASIVDNINLINGPTCLDPDQLFAQVNSNSSATLSWNGINSGSNYQVWTGPRFFFAGTQTASGHKQFVNTDSLILNNLTPGTCYEFLVRSICGPGDTSQWVGPFQYCTACAARTAPYFQNFEQALGATPPQCWDNPSHDGLQDWKFDAQTSEKPSQQDGDHTLGPNGGGIMAWLDDTDDANETTLISPQVDIRALNDPHLYFWLWAETNNPQISRKFLLHVDVKDHNGWNQNVAVLDIENSAWQRMEVDLRPFGDTVQIRFRGKDVDPLHYKDIAIDDFQISEVINTCTSAQNPANVWASALSCDTIELNWNVPAGNSIVEYGVQGFNRGNGTFEDSLTAPYLIAGLNPGTVYDFYVANVCGNDTSSFSGPISARTHSGPLPGAVFTLNTTIINGIFQLAVDASRSTYANSYQWIYSNGTGTGIKDTVTYAKSENGMQTVSLVVSNGCGNDTLTQSTLVNIGINETQKAIGFHIFPNPVRNTLQLQLSGLKPQELYLQLLDMQGRPVYKKAFQTQGASFETTINVEAFPEGLYFLHIKEETQVMQTKINIKR